MGWQAEAAEAVRRAVVALAAGCREYWAGAGLPLPKGRVASAEATEAAAEYVQECCGPPLPGYLYSALVAALAAALAAGVEGCE